MEFLRLIDLDPVIITRLALAAFLGGLVGLERELHGKPAGLRTNMFICMGSALFTLLSEVLVRKYGGPGADPTRIASQLIPGIGFIGAGSIIRSHGGVHGLTTAATIFVLASIGMAVGGGLYAIAIVATLMILVSLSVLGWLGQKFHWKTEVRAYRLEAATLEQILPRVLPALERRGLGLTNLSCRQTDGRHAVSFDIDASPDHHQALLREFADFGLICFSTTAPGEAERRVL